jgi:nicotinate phosphoribosyltransferase
MMQGYLMSNARARAVFDMFFRRQPFQGGYCIFAGLDDALQYLSRLSFTQEDLSYLESLGMFGKDFLDYLSGFRFTADVYAMEEGEVVFPNEPLLRVHGSLIEAQLVESALLNIINFQTLIATKAARIALAAKGSPVLEFGLRRAQGPDGALSAARAAFIGGAGATSNTLAGKRYGIPVRGTMAHSWIMSFPNEREAFQRYAEIYPDGCTLLIDTYDTLGSGIENAIAVGRKLMEAGKKGFGVRLDSGDLEYMSKRVRERLDSAGLHEAKIVVSNELDEHIIAQLVSRGAPIDVWGVGTHLVTGGGDPALTGVYKIAAMLSGETGAAWTPVIKVSNNPEKVTNPGIKQVWRFSSERGGPLADLVCLEDEEIPPGRPYTFHHPGDYRSFTLSDYSGARALLIPVMKEGRVLHPPAALPAFQDRARKNLEALDDTYKRLINPHVYKVSLSPKLKSLKQSLIEDAGKKGGGT